MDAALLSDTVRIADPIAVRNLTIFPLFGETQTTRPYLTLDEALRQGLAETTEVSDAGSVPELRFVNRADKPVLLLDGEELTGAKQNRILNLSILATANATTLIAVSCIEAGRWTFKSRAFQTTERTQHARGRAMKMASVSSSLRRSGAARSDQSEVWREVERKFEAMHAASPTAALSDLFDARRNDIDEFAFSATLPAEATGAAFAINGQVLGLELFDSTEVAAKLLAKIVRSWAIDALERERPKAGKEKDAVAEDVAALLMRISKVKTERYEANGDGEHIRFEDNAVVGGALRWRGAPVHTIAYSRAITA